MFAFGQTSACSSHTSDRLNLNQIVHSAPEQLQLGLYTGLFSLFSASLLSKLETVLWPPVYS